MSSQVPLVRPERVRVAVRQLPGWPASASALFDWLRERVTREHLLDIASTDGPGAPAHLRILVSIWKSGRVPAVLEFDPCEALRMYHRAPGENADPLGLAFCRTLLCISPSNYGDDDGANYAAPLVESCLAVGGRAPALAEQLMAWLAVSEPPGVADLRDDHGRPNPVPLMAMGLLRIATDPTTRACPA